MFQIWDGMKPTVNDVRAYLLKCLDVRTPLNLVYIKDGALFASSTGWRDCLDSLYGILLPDYSTIMCFSSVNHELLQPLFNDKNEERVTSKDIELWIEKNVSSHHPVRVATKKDVELVEEYLFEIKDTIFLLLQAGVKVLQHCNWNTLAWVYNRSVFGTECVVDAIGSIDRISSYLKTRGDILLFSEFPPQNH